MNHQAIYALYPTVVTIDDGAGAFDKDGNKIEIDLGAVASWTDPDLYKIQRSSNYPSFAEQFDLLYHGGYDAWRAKIQEIKDQFPKDPT
jgi:hypothetical protein